MNVAPTGIPICRPRSRSPNNCRPSSSYIHLVQQIELDPLPRLSGDEGTHALVTFPYRERSSNKRPNLKRHRNRTKSFSSNHKSRGISGGTTHRALRTAVRRPRHPGSPFRKGLTGLPLGETRGPRPDPPSNSEREMKTNICMKIHTEMNTEQNKTRSMKIKRAV